MESIHDYDSKMKSVMKALHNASMSEENRKVILNYLNFCTLENLSKGRVIKYAYYMIRLTGWLGTEWETADVPDLEKLVLEINNSDYPEQSKKEYKTCIKKFCKWLKKTEDYPDIVKWIKPHNKRLSRMRLPEEILSKEDIPSLIRHADSVRDKAFLSCLMCAENI